MQPSTRREPGHGGSVLKGTTCTYRGLTPDAWLRRRQVGDGDRAEPQDREPLSLTYSYTLGSGRLDAHAAGRGREIATARVP